ncbi:MAG: SWIM zinc finger family protein [Clostridiales bacterium]|nr:SWIM zinc finger family protein [Clostridiales bacterium]
MWGFDEYVPVAEKRAKAQKQIEKLRKKNAGIKPVIVEGNKVVKTWWGIAWIKNLESYADYANRIGRGRAYVKNGFVLDLQLEEGLITGLVQGSQAKPYDISISIAPLSKEKWQKIVSAYGHSVASLEALAEGRFPQELSDSFMAQGSLFPSPREIQLSCSCPDWANMCKHVAAVLYGVGARFDADPLLFFKLRGIPFKELLKKSVQEKMNNMLKNANQKTSRMIDETAVDVSGLFGIEIPAEH